MCSKRINPLLRIIPWSHDCRSAELHRRGRHIHLRDQHGKGKVCCSVGDSILLEQREAPAGMVQVTVEYLFHVTLQKCGRQAPTHDFKAILCRDEHILHHVCRSMSKTKDLNCTKCENSCFTPRHFTFVHLNMNRLFKKIPNSASPNSELLLGNSVSIRHGRKSVGADRRMSLWVRRRDERTIYALFYSSA